MIIIFVVFIDQLIDYLINRASLNWFQSYYRYEEFCCHIKCPERGLTVFLKICVEDLRPSQPNGVMSSAVSLSNHTFTGQA